MAHGIPGDGSTSGLRSEFIGYPDRVKQLLMVHCTDLGRDAYIQGKGMPNLIKMLLNT